MSRTPGIKKSRGVSDAAVRKATGKGWDEWFEILDSAGGGKLDHKGIVAILSEQHQVSPWWQQRVTVAYERERGLRAKHQTPSGFQVSRSKTVSIPLAELYQAWSNEQLRKRWLPDRTLAIRKSTPEKSLRITWEDDTNVEVFFSSKDEAKSQVTVQHSKLAAEEDVERVKKYWGEVLERLRDLLEG